MTLRTYTSVKIATQCDQPVVYVKDASRAVAVVAALLDTDKKFNFITQTKQEYQDLRQAYAEMLHERVRIDYWGYQADECHNNEELIQ